MTSKDTEINAPFITSKVSVINFFNLIVKKNPGKSTKDIINFIKENGAVCRYKHFESRVYKNIDMMTKAIQLKNINVKEEIKKEMKYMINEEWDKNTNTEKKYRKLQECLLDNWIQEFIKN